jgi:hypothetical protein
VNPSTRQAVDTTRYLRYPSPAKQGCVIMVEGAKGWFRNFQNRGALGHGLTSGLLHRRTCMGHRRTEFLIKRFPPAFAEAATRRQVWNFLRHPSAPSLSCVLSI